MTMKVIKRNTSFRISILAAGKSLTETDINPVAEGSAWRLLEVFPYPNCFAVLGFSAGEPGVVVLLSRSLKNYRMVEVGRVLWRSSGPTSLLTQGHPTKWVGSMCIHLCGIQKTVLAIIAKSQVIMNSLSNTNPEQYQRKSYTEYD